MKTKSIIVLSVLMLALLLGGAGSSVRRKTVMVALGLFGAALLYGDGMLTPAISVLSAVEGLEVLQPSLHSFVVPLTVAIIVGLFLFQRKGTAGVGKLFGPVTLLWFLALAALGVHGILMAPEILAALNPTHAAAFFAGGRILRSGSGESSTVNTPTAIDAAITK